MRTRAAAPVIQIKAARQKSAHYLVWRIFVPRRANMDKDRIKGSAKVVAGKAKVAVGKVLGDAKLQAEGQAEKVEGTVQNAVGSVKDAVRDAMKTK
jgi:uncharacterized protein YjbJ (UPF0337 family)